MHFYDQQASVVNLAKGYLRDLDRSSVDTKIPTATLELLLNTLVQLGTPQHVLDAGERGNKTLMALGVEADNAVRQRDERQKAASDRGEADRLKHGW